MGYISKCNSFNFFVAIQMCSDLWLSEEAVWCYKEWNWFVTCSWKLHSILLHLHSWAQATVSDLHFWLDKGMVKHKGLTRWWMGLCSSWCPMRVPLTQMLLWFYKSWAKKLLTWLMKRTYLNLPKNDNLSDLFFSSWMCRCLFSNRISGQGKQSKIPSSRRHTKLDCCKEQDKLSRNLKKTQSDSRLCIMFCMKKWHVHSCLGCLLFFGSLLVCVLCVWSFCLFFPQWDLPVICASAAFVGDSFLMRTQKTRLRNIDMLIDLQHLLIY